MNMSNEERLARMTLDVVLVFSKYDAEPDEVRAVFQTVESRLEGAKK